MDEWGFFRQPGLPLLASVLNLSDRERIDVADLTSPFSSNLLRNPSGSNANTAGWTAYGGGTGGTATLSRVATGGVDGGPFVRNTTAKTGTGVIFPDLSNHGHSSGNTDYLTVGKVGGVGAAFTVLGAGRVTQAPTACTQIALTMHASRADGTYLGGFGAVVFAANPVTGEWYETGPRTFTVPATAGGEPLTNAHRLRPGVYFVLPSPTQDGGTYILDADHVGVYPAGQPVTAYRDGDSEGWEWIAGNNRLPNPSAETNTTGWTSTGTTLTRDSAWAAAGSWSLRTTHAALTNSDVSLYSGYTAWEPGTIAYARAALRAHNAFGGGACARLEWWGGTALLSTVDLGPIASGMAAAATHTFAGGAVAPPGTTRVRLRLYVATSGTQNVDVAWDAIMLSDKPIPAYADGSSSGWAWAGTAHASTSSTGTPHGSPSRRTADGWVRTRNEGLSQRLREVDAGTARALIELSTIEDMALTALAPAAYWRLTETSGTAAADASGNGHGGTYANGVLLGVTGPANGGKAARFDGVDDEITLATAPAFAELPFFTISAWVRYSTAPPSSGIVITQTGGAATLAALSPVDTSGDMRFLIRNNEGAILTLSAAGAMDGMWHHCVGVRSGATAFLYVDGRLVASGAAPGGTYTVAATRIGRGTDSANPHAGDIAHVALFDRALSLDEIRALRAAALWNT